MDEAARFRISDEALRKGRKRSPPPRKIDIAFVGREMRSHGEVGTILHPGPAALPLQMEVDAAGSAMLALRERQTHGQATSRRGIALQLIQLDFADDIFGNPDAAAAIERAGLTDEVQTIERLAGLLQRAVEALAPETAAGLAA